ncbi:MAG: CYTH domain-containing protein [Candidatus Saccharibacteria bacterium]
MIADFEIELRGPLTDEKFHSLKSFLEKNGKFKEEKNRVFYDYSTFIPGEGLRGRTKDFRVRETNGQPEVILKLGKWQGSDRREELSVLTEKNSTETLLKIFGEMGFTKAIKGVRHTFAYDYKDIEIALVEVPGHSFYFEAEIVAPAKSNHDKVHQKINDELNELGLKTFSDDGFHDYIDKLNNESNEIYKYKKEE